TLVKRALSPLVVSSRNMAEYNVAAGVLPPGEVQYCRALIAAISSLHVIGLPSSASTLAAASRALSFFAFGSAGAVRWRFGLAGSVDVPVWSGAGAGTRAAGSAVVGSGAVAPCSVAAGSTAGGV